MADTTPLRESRDFRLIWTGQLVSWIGSQMTAVAIPFQVYLRTRSSLAVGLLGLVEVVPLVVTGLLGGAIADAVDRRKLMLLTQSLLASVSVALAFGAIGRGAPLGVIYVLAGLAAGLSGIDLPTRAATVPRLVRREILPAALSLQTIVFTTGFMAGPALGGVIIARFGLPWTYVFDVASFSVAMVTVYMMSPQPPPSRIGGTTAATPLGLANLREGLSYVKRHPPLAGSFLADLNAMIFGMPKALFPALAATTFHVGPSGLGLLYAAPGIGALLGAVATGWISRVRHHGRGVLLAVAAWGAAITGFGFCGRLFALAIVLLAIAGAADSFSAVLRNLILQGEAPDEMRGRLSAVFIVVVRGGVPLGDIEAGGVATLTTPKFSAVSGGLACLAGVGVLAAAMPAFRRYRLDLSNRYSGPAPAPKT